MATLLVAREVPAAGGDTLFANQYLAYDTLSDGMKRLLGGLKGVASSAKANSSRTREDRIRSDGSAESAQAAGRGASGRAHTPGNGADGAVRQPRPHCRVRRHDRRGERSGIDFLFDHQIRPEFTCRFRWEARSLAIWDNRCAQHYAVNDYHGQRRVMHRITLAGDRPV